MVKLQCRTGEDLDNPDNVFTTIPKPLVVSKGWLPGDEVGFFIVGQGMLPEQGDLIIRKIRDRVPKKAKK